MTIDDEVRRATKLLETIMQAAGLTRKDLDQRLGAGPGYVSQLFTGRMELKMRHILAILRAVDVEPGVFFQTLYPDGPPVADRLLMEEFLKRYKKLGLEPQAASALPVSPPSSLDYGELHQLIQSAVRSVLQEEGGAVKPAPGGANPGDKPPPKGS
jgi:transcriptional regulator with XRE-family HTH domain